MNVLLADTGCTGAEGQIDLAKCISLGNENTLDAVYNTPSALINTIVTNLFIIAGVILFGMIFYSGFKFIQQGTKGKDEARQIIRTAVTGFIIMFTAFWIVQIVEIITGVNILL